MIALIWFACTRCKSLNKHKRNTRKETTLGKEDVGLKMYSGNTFIYTAIDSAERNHRNHPSMKITELALKKCLDNYVNNFKAFCVLHSVFILSFCLLVQIFRTHFDSVLAPCGSVKQHAF